MGTGFVVQEGRSVSFFLCFFFLVRKLLKLVIVPLLRHQSWRMISFLLIFTLKEFPASRKWRVPSARPGLSSARVRRCHVTSGAATAAREPQGEHVLTRLRFLRCPEVPSHSLSVWLGRVLQPALPSLHFQ